MNYKIPTEITAELKLNKWFYLTDLLVLIGMLVMGFVLHAMIHPSLTIPFIIFMVALYGFWLWKPKTNPNMRMLSAVWMMLSRDRATYHAHDPHEDEAKEDKA
ncbi:hypothetical protein HUG15_21135 [Salicibibacter cibarius]|uniref:PrgI family protein n=1 Tax=Salicibibacter cibarius TaxID=2743000 RepID=A0A7T6Z6C1_9BACI|nr:DUF5592 family protein [Salicibibacter cibarius]QQK77833.1 hypothetical protein HUG15_21135 [Salicibibacter cibarius]